MEIPVRSISGPARETKPACGLHYSLAEHARQEGVSMNQYCVYLLSKNDAMEKA